MSAPTYHVALSFAGEQRAYVEDVARALQARGIAVFYDGFEQAKLWGLNGVEYLNNIYEHNSGRVLMFISAEYVEKSWPKLERRSALSRAMREHGEYILPVRFDETVVPGLPGDVFYLKAADYGPAELAALVAEKLGAKPFEGKASQIPPPYMSSLTGEIEFDYSSHSGRYVIGRGRLEFETRWSKASNVSIHIVNDPPSINGVAVAKGAKKISEVTDAGKLDYTSRNRTPKLSEVVSLRNRHGFYAALQILELADDTRGAKADSIRFRYAIQPDGGDSFTQFADI